MHTTTDRFPRAVEMLGEVLCTLLGALLLLLLRPIIRPIARTLDVDFDAPYEQLEGEVAAAERRGRFAEALAAGRITFTDEPHPHLARQLTVYGEPDYLSASSGYRGPDSAMLDALRYLGPNTFGQATR